VPYKIHTVLTDNGIHFTIPGGGGLTVGEIKEAIANGALFRAHAFELAYARNDIDHRLTKPKHPWTTDVIDKCFLFRFVIFFFCARVTARQRASRAAFIVVPRLRRVSDLYFPSCELRNEARMPIGG
jgi:hypothetical protein